MELQQQIQLVDFQMHRVMIYYFLLFLLIDPERLKLEHRVLYIHLQMQIHFIRQLEEPIKQLQKLKVILLEHSRDH